MSKILCTLLALTACAINISANYASGSSGGGGSGSSDSSSAINSAIYSKSFMKIKNMPGMNKAQPVPEIIIPGNLSPMTLKFKTTSSNMNVMQSYQGQPGKTQYANNVDATWMLKQTVKKPIVQVVREIVMPMRKIIQEVRPVKQMVKTMVSQSGATTAAPTSAPPAAEPTGEPVYEPMSEPMSEPSAEPWNQMGGNDWESESDSYSMDKK